MGLESEKQNLTQNETDYGIGVTPVREPKILSFDLEVSPAVGWYYPPTWETRILDVQERQKLMSFAWQWVKADGSVSEPEALCLADFAYKYKLDPRDDSLITKALHEVMSQADAYITQNGDNFDVKMANYFFLLNKLGPVPEAKSIDTKKMAKRFFRFNNNTLDNIAKELGFEGKTDVKHADIWQDCFIHGDLEKWKLMCEYNKNDVVQTTNIYLEMRPFARNHPNMARIAGLEYACPTCLSTEYTKSGNRYTGISKFQRFDCTKCGRGFTERTAVKMKDGDIKPAFNNA